MTDAFVVGAGPAGSSAALRLARAGFRVTVLERSRFPRTKVCGEYLSPGACAQLDRLGLLEIVRREAHPIRRVVLAGFGSDPADMRLPADGALSLPRSRFDEIIADAARGAGAAFVHGAFLSCEQRSDHIDVRYRDAAGDEKQESAALLVGADGAWSSVAQRTGMSQTIERKGRWAVGGHLLEQDDSDALEMHVGPGGYFARNPLGHGAANEMLVTDVVRGPEVAEQAVAEITAGRRRFEAASIVKRVAVGPLRYRPRRIAHGRVFLAGDAAGLLDPFVGQGIAVALETSSAVLDVVASVTRGGSLSAARARFARARRAAASGRRLLASAVAMLIRNGPLRRRADRAFRRDPAGAEAVLAAVAGAVPAWTAFSLPSLARLLS